MWKKQFEITAFVLQITGFFLNFNFILTIGVHIIGEKIVFDNIK